MCDVFRSTFTNVLPTIERHIDAADFIAFDAEYTGLRLTDFDRPSLFDSGEDRYRKLRKSVTKFSISQVGISLFVRESVQDNVYVAHSYNFYLFPSSFGPIDVHFVVQASSFDFLTKHGFDFNKYVYDGVSFLNDEQEEKLRLHFQKMDHIHGLDRDVDEAAIQDYCSKIASWIVKAEVGERICLENLEHVSDAVLSAELKERFKNIWVQADHRQIVVEKVTPEKKAQLSEEFKHQEEQSITENMLGFTRVFRLLMKYKKPIIGHNCYTDLMLFYDKFYKPLPEKYSVYKADIMAMFPCIFDTKHITLCLRKKLEDTGLLELSGLESLYQSLHSEKGRLRVLCSPTVKHGEGCEKYNDRHAHEAGYDAFMCGYVFLRIAHLHVGLAINSSDIRPMAFIEYLKTMQSFANKVNLIRGAVNHVTLDDADPSSQRPRWLYVCCRRSELILVNTELARMFSQYGSVDIRLLGKTKALVAVANHRSSREILKAFRKHRDIRVVKYDFWKHSTLVRISMWSGVVLFGSISALTLYSGFRNAQLSS